MKTLLLLVACSIPVLAAAAPVAVTVHDYPSGDGPADLVSFGVPFKPGELTQLSNVRILDGASEVPIGIKSLATWPMDGSIRVALVQLPAPFTGTTKSFTLEVVTARTTPDRTLVPVSWRLPRKIATLPASYLSASLVMWEQKPLGQTGYTGIYDERR